ncbi:MAG TPA: Gfo/Idh/MocA family oxidoreductase [Chloroflexota bacterium]|nr:Gfo/Idh/MocA family oxidoreductase [Chloroflexota bacterium]
MAGEVRFAIVGGGVISDVHARAIRGAQGAELTAVVDVEDKPRAAAAERLGVPGYGSVSELIAARVADAVTVAVPSGLHAEVGARAAHGGLHVLTEKPIEITLAAADRLIAACAAAGVTLGCISQSRTESDIAGAHAAVAAGRLGRMVLAKADTKWFRSQTYYDEGGWRGTWDLDGGGALMNQSIHAIDILQWVMGPVTSVSAYAATLTHEIEAEDNAVAAIRFASGALGVLEGSTSLKAGRPRRHEFHGDGGSIVLEDGRALVWDVADGAASPSTGIGPAATDGKVVGRMDHNPHRLQVEDFVAAISEGREPRVNGAEGRAPVELILAIYESASRDGEPVTLPL